MSEFLKWVHNLDNLDAEKLKKKKHIIRSITILTGSFPYFNPIALSSSDITGYCNMYLLYICNSYTSNREKGGG